MRRLLLDGLWWLLLAMPVSVVVVGRLNSGAGSWGLLLGLLALAVAVRRRTASPHAAVAVAAVLAVLDASFGGALAALAYGAGRRRDDRDDTGRAAGVLAGGMVAATLLHGAWFRDGYAWLVATVVLLLAGALPWAIGRLLSDRQELAVAGWRRATDLERQQQVAAVQARLLERSRIAQEMHDSLGHELSLIALRAGALELAANSGSAARQAARALREDVAVAVERLHDAVDVLREGSAPIIPVHESVADLVGRAQASGLDVDLRTTGESMALDPAADLAVHRVVQEALTNAVKHAPGAAVTVALHQHPERVDLRISNPAPQRGDNGPRGTGLTGLRERLHLVGGTLVAQRQGGRFGVEASVPVHPHATRPAAPDLTAELSDPLSGTARAHAAARRRVRRGMLLAAAAVCAAAVVVTAFWVAMTHDATLDAPTYDRIRVGESREDLAGLLPRREATRGWTGLLRAAPDGSLYCHFYSDGNYPAAFATYRLCFRDDVLVDKDDLRDGTGA